MSILAYLVLVVVLFGVGTLTATILPTRGARMGLGTALFLALVVDLTWFAAPLAEWSPVLGDAAWTGAFLLVAFVAVIVAGYYSRARGLPAWTWPSDRDMAFLALVIVLFGAFVFLLPVPLDTDAQGFGYLALMLRESGDYTTLAPWHPQVEYLYSPGYIGLIAHLSSRFDLGIHQLELIVGALNGVLFIWLAYDLGTELEGPRTGRAFMVAALLGTGLITAFLDSHFTALLALTFALAFLTFVLRHLNTGRWSDALFAAICLAGVPLSQPDITVALVIGYVPWLIVIWWSRPRPRFGRWLVIGAVIPLVALGIVAPWLLSIEHLLASGIASPFERDLSHWRTLVLMHGVLVVALAGVGVLVGLIRRTPALLLMIIWLIAIVEFSTLGLLEKVLPEALLKYDYPFSLAWHGPIIPYLVLGGTALVWFADQAGPVFVDRWVRRLALPLIALALIGIVGVVAFFDPLLEYSKNTPLNIFGAFSSQADVDAMRWLRDNTPDDAVILNHPGPHEGDWAPVISERNTIFFRPQPFFRGIPLDDEGDLAGQQQNQLKPFWAGGGGSSPELDYAAVLDRWQVDYILVPQVFGNPASFDGMLRWRRPLEEAARYFRTDLASLPYLQLVYDQDGAQVYRVLSPNERP